MMQSYIWILFIVFQLISSVQIHGRQILQSLPTRNIDDSDHMLIEKDRIVPLLFESAESEDRHEFKDALKSVMGTHVKLVPFIKEHSLTFLNHINEYFAYVNYIYDSIALELTSQYLREKEQHLRDLREYIPYHLKLELTKLQNGYLTVLKDHIKANFDLSIPDVHIFHDAYAGEMRPFIFRNGRFAEWSESCCFGRFVLVVPHGGV